MQPLTAEERLILLEHSPEATEADVDELETLAAARFTIDPEPATTFTEAAADQLSKKTRIEMRMAELSAKLRG